MAMTAWSANVSSKFDVLIRERTNFASANKDGSDGNALAQQWGGKTCPIPHVPLIDLTNRKLFFGLRSQVGNVNCPPVNYGPAAVEPRSIRSPYRRESAHICATG